MAETDQSVTIVYDGECPLCSRYVAMVRLREAFGRVDLVDARSDDPMAIEACKRFDMDEGMAVHMGGQWYHGADSMNVLSMAAGPVSAANRIFAAIFSNPRRARVLYPFLRTGRNALLRILGRRKING